ncbi:hypothetical protein JKP88DRAFT_280740 [Tribonema minus]|uniref:Uncharacterized protein n=1 Tax=Tribonema minus TaxID=303371 RepID=A0A835YQW1_9STRA|nr:hypothetical protein JKP88DRAFT_280740 [Tribonema minus]
MDQEIASAFSENRMHQYVEQRQRQQWGGYILKLQLAPQCFGVAARPVSGAGWQIHVMEYLNVNTHTVSDAKRVAESRARFEQEQRRRRAENGHIEDDNAYNDAEPGWIYGGDQEAIRGPHNPLWRSFTEDDYVPFCQRVRAAVSTHMGSAVEATAIVMASRKAPLAPYFYLYVKAATPTLAALQIFLQNISQDIVSDGGGSEAMQARLEAFRCTEVEEDLLCIQQRQEKVELLHQQELEQLHKDAAQREQELESKQVLLELTGHRAAEEF